MSVWAVAAFSLVSKLGLAVWSQCRRLPGFWQSDSASYHAMAQQILKAGVLSLERVPANLFEGYRAVGYPLLLALVYRLLGVSPLAVILLQVILGTGTVVLAYLLGREVFDETVGLWAALLVAIDLASVSETQILMSETAFTFLFVLSLWLVVRCIKGRAGTWSLVGAGLGLAVAAHIRPTGYYLPLLMAAALVVFALAANQPGGRGRQVWRRLVPRAGALLVVPVLLLGGWQVLSLARIGYASFSSMDGVNMLFYRGAGVLSLVERRSLVEVQSEMGLARDGEAPFAGYFRQHPEAESLNAAGVSNRWVKEGLVILARHPAQTLLLSLRGVVQVLLDPGVWELGRVVPVGAYGTRWEMAETVQKRPLELLRTFWQSDPVTILLMLTGIIWQILLVTGTLIWLIRRPGERSGLAWLLFILILYFLPFAAGPEGSSRFRVPFEPLLALLAVAGWRQVLRRRNRLHQTTDRHRPAPTQT